MDIIVGMVTKIGTKSFITQSLSRQPDKKHLQT